MAKQLLRLLIFIFLCLPFSSAAEEGTWTKKADMPTARSAASAAVFEGKVYVFGGRDADFYSDEGSILSTVEVYDPLSGTWTKEDDMPTPRCVHSSVVINGKIYVMGGDSLADLECHTHSGGI